MLISMIAAMASNNVIGANNKMPWHLPADLQHFKRLTLGKPIIMGRKTYQSIGKALPGRLNIVITSDKAFSVDDALVVNTCEQALSAAQAEPGTTEVMIIGGGTVYRHFMPLCNRLYLTLIDLDIAGDTVFPDYHQAGWQRLTEQSHHADEKNPHAYQFITLAK
ncbi:MAG: dihydrofolate reductase [Paraglaciecola sp.]|jgi:dihydrofolate reductase